MAPPFRVLTTGQPPLIPLAAVTMAGMAPPGPPAPGTVAARITWEAEAPPLQLPDPFAGPSPVQVAAGPADAFERLLERQWVALRTLAGGHRSLAEEIARVPRSAAAQRAALRQTFEPLVTRQRQAMARLEAGTAPETLSPRQRALHEAVRRAEVAFLGALEAAWVTPETGS